MILKTMYKPKVYQVQHLKYCCAIEQLAENPVVMMKNTKGALETTMVYMNILWIVSLLLTNNAILADEEDRVGHKSFHNFLEEQKKKQQSKSNKPS